MSKKSAASMKPVEPKQEIMSAEEQFKEQFEYEKTLINQQLTCVERIDFVADLRQDWNEFFGTFPEYNKVMKYREAAISLIKMMKNIIDGYTFEWFCSDEWEDKIGATFLESPEVCENDEDLWWAYMIYKIVRPFGEHANSMHTLVMELKRTENA